ncbi:MAG TPA: YceH family protein [Gaiellaceae bacterium]
MEPADPVEIRVLGSLIEKQRTTPDVYPLSLNALRLACNQSTSRDPIVDYDEPTIRGALERLSRKGWVRLASGPGSRAVKYRHLFDEALDLPDPELALLTVLMLRGPQTLGELKQRTERLYAFRTLDDVDRTMHALIERDLAAELPRRRFDHRLGSDTAEGSVDAPATLEQRVARLEEEVAELREALSGGEAPA